MLKITRNGHELGYNSFNFPGGEVGFKLDIKNHLTAYYSKTNFFAPAAYQTIDAKIHDSNDIVELAMAVDALRQVDRTPIRLFMPYVPYGRQDRVCDLGEAFSLQVFANIINFLAFDEVTVVDPHSNVTNAVFKTCGFMSNLKVISQFDLISRKASDFRDRVFRKPCIFVAPDAGASKKTAELAKFFGHASFIRADKNRDLSTGQIKETIVYCDDFKGQDVIICDDICDGGRTFIELAKVCKAKNCGNIVLFVTHGIFSKGVDELLKNGIDEIFTTDSFYVGESRDHVNVLKLCAE